MPIAAGYRQATGINNAITSIFKWLETEVPEDGYKYFFLAQAQPIVYPAVDVAQFPSNQPGYDANYIYPAGGSKKYGGLTSVLIRFNVYDRLEKAATAGRPKNLTPLKNIRQIWDRIETALRLAGAAEDSTVAPITLFDFDNAAADTGVTIIAPLWESGSLITQYFSPTADQVDIHMLRAIVKFNWYNLIR